MSALELARWEFGITTLITHERIALDAFDEVLELSAGKLGQAKGKP